MKNKVVGLIIIIFCLCGCQKDGYFDIGDKNIKILVPSTFATKEYRYVYEVSEEKYCSFELHLDSKQNYNTAKDYLKQKYNLDNIYYIEINDHNFYHYEGSINNETYSYYSTIINDSIYTLVFYDNSSDEYCLNVMSTISDNLFVK